MTEENETPKGLKFTVNNGEQKQSVEPENKNEEIEGEKENAITITKSGTRRKG